MRALEDGSYSPSAARTKLLDDPFGNGRTKLDPFSVAKTNLLDPFSAGSTDDSFSIAKTNLLDLPANDRSGEGHKLSLVRSLAFAQNLFPLMQSPVRHQFIVFRSNWRDFIKRFWSVSDEERARHEPVPRLAVLASFAIGKALAEVGDGEDDMEVFEQEAIYEFVPARWRR